MDLEARVAALETDRVDQRAVLAAVNALGVNQREMALTLRDHSRQLDDHTHRLERLESKTDDTNARVRSLEEGVAEIKGLLVQALNKCPQITATRP